MLSPYVLKGETRGKAINVKSTCWRHATIRQMALVNERRSICLLLREMRDLQDRPQICRSLDSAYTNPNLEFCKAQLERISLAVFRVAFNSAIKNMFCQFWVLHL